MIDAYANFFGTTPQVGGQNQLIFSATDAQRPFITENEQMWQFFELDIILLTQHHLVLKYLFYWVLTIPIHFFVLSILGREKHQKVFVEKAMHF